MCRNAAPVGIYTFVLSIQLCNLKIVRRVDTLLVKRVQVVGAQRVGLFFGLPARLAVRLNKTRQKESKQISEALKIKNLP